MDFSKLDPDTASETSDASRASLSGGEIRMSETGLPRPIEQVFSDSDLRHFVDFDAFLQSAGPDLLDASDYVGTGSVMVDDKRSLVGKRFIAMRWGFADSAEFEGGRFVVVHIITEDNERLMFTDGSKGGVRDQLLSISLETGKFEGLDFKKGLRLSEYDYVDPNDGKKKKARSYYIGN